MHKAPGLSLRWLAQVIQGERFNNWKLLCQASLFVGRSYDIVHCQFGTVALSAVALRNIGVLHGKLITTFRGYDISQYLTRHGEGVYSELFMTGDVFLTNCEFFKRRLIKLGCDHRKLWVHPSGLNVAKYQPAPESAGPGNTLKVVTIGRLIEKKGIEYGIRAIARFASIEPGATYAIIGSGPLKQQLQALACELGVADSVKFLGWKNQHEIIEILNRSDILMALSVTARDGNQDAPVNTLKEAMALELPVIATRHGGIPELVEDGRCGFLVPERDVEAITEKLVYLAAHRERWPEMGRAGRAYVRAHYDLDTLNDELVTIYRRALG